MRHISSPRPSADRRGGFTLVEVMIVVALVAILAVVAYPSYQDSVRKSRRSEAFAALSAVQQAQERWRANHAAYGNLASPADANTLPGIATTTANGYYTIAVASPGATGYVVTATAAGTQASDTACYVLGTRLLDGNMSHGSGASSINWGAADPDAGRCWAK